MRAAAGFLTVLCIGALSQALATEPPSSSAQQAAPAASTQADRTAAGPATKSPETPAATSTAATASDSGNVSLKAGDDDAAAQLKRFRAAGYKPEVHNGEVVFCRKEVLLGSRFDKKICNTADQLVRIEAEAREVTARAQRNTSGTPRGGN
jgi:hypothetical protein